MYKIVGSVRSRLTRVTWMLEELGQPYEILNLAPQSEEMKQFNPMGKVPVLVDPHGESDFTIIDSAAICAYLADRHPEKNMSAPLGTAQRAAIDSWLHFSQSDLEAPLWLKAKHKFILPEALRLSGVKDVAQYEFDLAVAGMEKRLGDNEFAIGDRMTAADVLLGHTGAWARIARFTVKSDVVKNYFERMLSRPAFLRAQKKEEQHVGGLGL